MYIFQALLNSFLASVALLAAFALIGKKMSNSIAAIAHLNDDLMFVIMFLCRILFQCWIYFLMRNIVFSHGC